MEIIGLETMRQLGNSSKDRYQISSTGILTALRWSVKIYVDLQVKQQYSFAQDGFSLDLFILSQEAIIL
jgi:hypothetical protein